MNMLIAARINKILLRIILPKENNKLKKLIDPSGLQQLRKYQKLKKIINLMN